MRKIAKTFVMILPLLTIPFLAQAFPKYSIEKMCRGSLNCMENQEFSKSEAKEAWEKASSKRKKKCEEFIQNTSSHGDYYSLYDCLINGI